MTVWLVGWLARFGLVRLASERKCHQHRHQRHYFSIRNINNAITKPPALYLPKKSGRNELLICVYKALHTHKHIYTHT